MKKPLPDEKTLRLALKLADDNAVMTVHSLCSPADDWNDDAGASGFHRAWFLPGPNDEGRADVLESVRYGVARGLFVRNLRARTVSLVVTR